MKQFESFTNKISVPSFTADGSFHTVTLTGICADTKLVSVEIDCNVAGGSVGVRPTGTALADNVFEFTVPINSYSTVIMRVDENDQLDFSSTSSSINFSLTGKWGGDAVHDFGPNMRQAMGWTVDNSESWRDFDLTSFIFQIDFNHLFSVEAAICFLRPNNGLDASSSSAADVRGNGSTWPVTTQRFGGTANRMDSIVPVDRDNIIEVYEGDDGDKDPMQNSFVYFAGYILKGGYDDGSGTCYRYRSILNPVNRSFDFPGAEWKALNITSRTSATAVNVYQRMQWIAVPINSLLYARDVGSTDTELTQALNRNYVAGFPLAIDANGDVENFVPFNANALRWIFGYIDESPKRRSVMVTHV